MLDLLFYKNKKVLLTGHTGFKGSWMSVVLANAGANVIGYSSCSKTETRLFDLCGICNQITHIKGDIRNLHYLIAVRQEFQPDRQENAGADQERQHDGAPNKIVQVVQHLLKIHSVPSNGFRRSGTAPPYILHGKTALCATV